MSPAFLITSKMGKQKKTYCPSIPHCVGSEVKDIYDSFCSVLGACGYCGHFIDRDPIKQLETISEPRRELINGKHKWKFADTSLENLR